MASCKRNSLSGLISSEQESSGHLAERCLLKKSFDKLVPTFKSPLSKASPNSSEMKSLASTPTTSTTDSSPTLAKSMLSKIDLQKLFQEDKVVSLRNEVRNFNMQFTMSIDWVVQCWMPSFILDIKNFAEKLSFTLHQTLLDDFQAQFEANFALNMTNKQIAEMNQMYSNFYCELNIFDNTKSGQFFDESILMPCEPLPANESIYCLYSQIRHKMIEAKSHLWKLQQGIHLLVPTLDDSNNSGVMLQKSMISEVDDMRSKVISFLLEKGWTDYANERLGHLKNLFDLPQSEDNRLILNTVEQNRCLYFRQCVQSIMMQMLILQNLLRRNLNKIKTPRVDHCSEMAAKIIT